MLFIPHVSHYSRALLCLCTQHVALAGMRSVVFLRRTCHGGDFFHVEFSLETTGQDAHGFAHGNARESVLCAALRSADDCMLAAVMSFQETFGSVSHCAH